MKAIEAIRNANRPSLPEHSVSLRVACLCTVSIAIAACASMGEISIPTAIAGVALVAVGMIVSYATRSRPPGWIKFLVAGGAIAASAWFVHAITAPVSDVANIEEPLTVLLLCILVVHSFHVPARRDLMFSLAASAGLMAVGGAQAIDLSFGFYVLAWVCSGLSGLILMWRSASSGGALSPGRLAVVLGGITAAASAIFLVLPAPTVAAKLSMFARAGSGGSIGVPGGLAGDSGGPSQLARPGSPAGATRVGGYLGFANSLDTALRGKLGNTLVMQVRAQRPSYWVGETFDAWSGKSWTTTRTASHLLRERSPFLLPAVQGNGAVSQSDLQTFYVESSTANLVFHAQSANELWFPSSKVYYSDDGTIVSPIGLGKGAIYSVESQVSAPTPQELRSSIGGTVLSAAAAKSYFQLPHAYPRVQRLARAVTKGDITTYDRVESLIAWMGSHSHYSLDIPPLPAGADTVDEFLFGNRVGFCEQISTSLAVMLRSIGIPTREVVGYVPGPYDPITDLYQIRAEDAHAWVQVWFPGYGWQSFDPTAVVPLANPSPGATALHDVGAALRRIPVLPASSVLLGAGLGALLLRWRRSRPRSWTERIARQAERAGRRAGHPRLPQVTLVEYATLLDNLSTNHSMTWMQLASPVEASVYGQLEPSPDTRRDLVTRAKKLRRITTRKRRRQVPPRVPPVLNPEPYRLREDTASGEALPTTGDER
jgi:protein-glutamine gamma-glutamyltransferase